MDKANSRGQPGAVDWESATLRQPHPHVAADLSGKTLAIEGQAGGEWGAYPRPVRRNAPGREMNF